MDQHPQERRFSRVHFNARVALTQDSQQLTGDLLDISLNGLLMVQPGAERLHPERPVVARIQLAEATTITMLARIAHREAQYLGLACESIDVESICHLRRLLELNLSDPKALERELSELIAG